jgi:hypothetical protein
MATDKPGRRAGGDDGTISIAQSYELTYWCKRLATTPELLREAMSEVGDRLADLQDFLRKASARR